MHTYTTAHTDPLFSDLYCYALFRLIHDMVLSVFDSHIPLLRASLIAHSVKNLSAMQETQVLFLGQEDPLEKEMATHSSIIAWWTAVHGVAKSQPQLSD